MLDYKKSVSLSRFIVNMQLAGDKLRLFGSYDGETASPDNMYVIPEAMRMVIRAYRKARGHRKFVINSFRNPFEIEYFKRRYAEFYLIAVVRDRRDSITSLRRIFESDKEIDGMWRKESGKDPAGGRSAEEVKKTRENIGWWVTGQNIPECVQKADIFIFNRRGDHFNIKFHLAKLLSLAHKPGCLTPTEDERGMQIACTARLMSGCLSRQVGAAVVGSHGYVLGIGWNDPPQDQVPCALRTCKELFEDVRASDHPFSNYEMRDPFKSHMSSKLSDAPFCFRAELAEIEGGTKRAEYTRALHAEENAFLQTAKVGGTSVRGSTLYTTASTCTLCAKKAYQLEVKRIVYIEEYPDLAFEQTISLGTNRPDYEQFEGIAGSAFFSLYSPLMPEKDLIAYYS